MRDRYQPAEFEAKWRAKWAEADLFKTQEDEGKPKFYGLDFFPYPSGAGLSVGHCRNYIPTDVICRMKVMQGYNVLHPMGFDAFGLPAENEAIKTKRQPAEMIVAYGARYREQLDLVGISYDWSRCFYSSDPSYYKWTQWIFKLLYEKGLAYRRMAEVNWCPKDKTALANEEVIGGLCDRCGTPVEKKAIPQWFFKITDYAQRLIDDLDELDWPEGIKLQQRNWIGRSEGVEFTMNVAFDEQDGQDGDFQVVRRKPTIRVFTTRIDTVFGMTFCVLAPEHPLVATIKKNVGPEKQEEIAAYQLKAKQLSDADRVATQNAKSGVFSGCYAVNPVNGRKVPIFIADYVLMGYGTGAIMAVPAHDQRDLDFAVAHGLEVIPVLQPDTEYLEAFATDSESTEQAYERYLKNPKDFYPPYVSKEASLINSGEYTGLIGETARLTLGQWVEACGIGERKVNYRLRDWLISRQRYWGCPIPVVYDKEDQPELVPDSLLPVELPLVDHYEPADDGSSPLSRITDWLNTTTSEGTLGRRETDTMGGFACSSWYFLRFADPFNDERAFDPAQVAKWLPVDCYVGGAEHAVMHLLYARFWTKVLYDAGLINFKEPFRRLVNQGQVLALTPYRQPREGETLGVGEDGILVSFKEAANMNAEELDWRWVRMSKSKGNVVTPEEAVETHGADALRMYELFVAPFEQAIQWSTEGIQGQVRFLGRFMKLMSDLSVHFDQDWPLLIHQHEPTTLSKKIRQNTHALIEKATTDIDKFAFNTYVSSLMKSVNTLGDLTKKSEYDPAEIAAISEAVQSFILVIAPAAPHTADELWEGLGMPGFTYHAGWPKFDPELAKADTVVVPVQVNGKLRDTVELAADATNEDMEQAARTDKVRPYLEQGTVRKVVVVPGKLVNFVVG